MAAALRRLPGYKVARRPPQQREMAVQETSFGLGRGGGQMTDANERDASDSHGSSDEGGTAVATDVVSVKIGVATKWQGPVSSRWSANPWSIELSTPWACAMEDPSSPASIRATQCTSQIIIALTDATKLSSTSSATHRRKRWGGHRAWLTRGGSLGPAGWLSNAPYWKENESICMSEGAQALGLQGKQRSLCCCSSAGRRSGRANEAQVRWWPRSPAGWIETAPRPTRSTFPMLSLGGRDRHVPDLAHGVTQFGRSGLGVSMHTRCWRTSIFTSAFRPTGPLSRRATRSMNVELHSRTREASQRRGPPRLPRRGGACDERGFIFEGRRHLNEATTAGSATAMNRRR
jgi:hypothetical protein